MRVVDFGQIVAMPLVGQWLAFLGAEVILVESRANLPSRGFSPFAGEPRHDASALFNQINRNKRSCTLNLRTQEGRDLARRLVATADVVLENFSPGTMAKLGFGYDELRALKPNLVMVSLSAFGSTGPWQRFAAFHSGVIALSGLAAVTGYEDGHPRIVGSILPDPIAATYSLIAVAQGLYHRRRTGRGQHVELAMIELLQSLLPDTILEYTMLGRERPRIGNRHPWKAPHGIYRARGDDRWLAISVGTEDEWRALCEALGQPALTEDPRFADRAQRHQNQAALDAIISTWTRMRDPDEAARRLQRAGVPATKVYNARDILTDPHLVERGFVVADEHPVAGSRPMLAAPWRVDGMAPIAYRHAPRLGADNDYVLGEVLGLTAEAIARLVTRQVVH